MEKESETDKAFAPLTVIKVGGAVVEDEAQLTRLINDFSAIPGRKVLVHGGGRRATKVAAALGIESKMVDGRRITDADMLDGDAARVDLILDVAHQMSLVSYSMGSSYPASLKPCRRSLQLSQTPQAFSPPL